MRAVCEQAHPIKSSELWSLSLKKKTYYSVAAV